ncbi:MAG: endonuclease/exonuclease/phosphatase family protein [Patescibacteria group bacterium]
MNLKVISWNIWYGKYFEQVVDFLRRGDADVICLQEIIADSSGANNTAASITKLLGCNFVYGFALDKVLGGRVVKWGNAVLSKYQIISSKTYVLAQGDPRIALEANIQINGEILNVFTTHLVHAHQRDSKIQNLQADNLVKILKRERTVLAGDFNATPHSYPVNTVGKILINVDATTSPTWSVYPGGCEVCKPKGLEFRLDYIFASADLTASNFKIGQSRGSDHLPISATIEFPT